MVAPHRWTPFFRIARDRQVIQEDARLWDYKHQVLATRLKPWMLFFSVKLGSVGIHREFITAAAKWIMAAKL